MTDERKKLETMMPEYEEMMKSYKDYGAGARVLAALDEIGIEKDYLQAKEFNDLLESARQVK